MTDNPRSILAADLSTLQQDRVFHGFFTRKCGVSTGIYKSLNAGLESDDVREHVLENRRRVADSLGVRKRHLVTVHQVHSANDVTVKAPFAGECPRADAMVTRTDSLVLGVLTADCWPVLFAGRPGTRYRRSSCRLARRPGRHSGKYRISYASPWCKKGRYPGHPRPLCIGPQNYEVGKEFHAIFLAASSANKHYFLPSPKPGHFYFNLLSFITGRLKKAGLQTGTLDICTYADESRFFSYRPTTHNHEPDYGRQISAIILERQP